MIYAFGDSYSAYSSYVFQGRDSVPGVDSSFQPDLKIKKTIKPKQGRIVIFDGSYWHSGSQPKKNIRCIINTDIKK